MLDAAGLSDTQVVASNDLDPRRSSRPAQGARIDSWGVGTKPRHPATTSRARRRVQADGVAVVADPGQGQRRRRRSRCRGCRGAPLHDGDGTARADMIWDELAVVDGSRVIVDPVDSPPAHGGRRLDIAGLVVPVFRAGERVYDLPSLGDARDHARHELGTLPAILRQLRPHWYPAGLEWAASAARRCRGGARARGPRA